jgi:hypothetical protein
MSVILLREALSLKKNANLFVSQENVLLVLTVQLKITEKSALVGIL